MPMSAKSNATFQLTSQGKTWNLASPQVLGIVNCTPDSFFAGNRFEATDQATAEGIRMIHAGAHALDIGGQSTRPNAIEVGALEEWTRIKDVLKSILNEIPQAIISVDTFHGEVAERALDAGAFMINDVYAGQKDERLIQAISSHNAPLVIMHMQGTPANMQENPSYTHASLEIQEWLALRSKVLREQGVKQLIIDPGFGFGKTIAHNFQILRDLRELKKLGLPVLAGLSRKSMIWKALESSPEDAMNGTTVLNAWALDRGAHILRVHDVREAIEAIKLFSLLESA